MSRGAARQINADEASPAPTMEVEVVEAAIDNLCSDNVCDAIGTLLKLKLVKGQHPELLAYYQATLMVLSGLPRYRTLIPYFEAL